MDDFETLTLLSRLPPREKCTTSATVDYSNTAVEVFVRDSVTPAPFTTEECEAINVNGIMDKLFATQESFPVRFEALRRLYAAPERKRLQSAYPMFFARLLVTLNGGGYKIIGDDLVKVAADRERRMSRTSTGWGTCDAFNYPDFIATLVLKSVGVPAEVLPAVKPMPADAKSKMTEAWKSACSLHGW